MSKLTPIRFSWRAFLTGLIVSSVSISLFGYFATGTNNFLNFVRFYRDISPESLYYPSARQVKSLVDSRYDSAKTLVVVGGSSVFRGVGQSNAGLWTRVLLVLVATGQAPFYVGRLEPGDQAGVETFYDTWMDIVQQSGIMPVPAYNELTDDDHFDRVHLNEHGGAKLAHFVAPFVKQKAKELGYVD